MTLKRIGVLSLGLMAGGIYASIGLIIGFFFTVLSLLGSAMSMMDQGGGEAAFGFLFGIGAIVIFPILYGILGFIGGMLVALFYNLIAKFLGGVEIELE